MMSDRKRDHAPTFFIRDFDDPLAPVFVRNISEVTRSEVRLSPGRFIIWQIQIRWGLNGRFLDSRIGSCNKALFCLLIAVL